MLSGFSRPRLLFPQMSVDHDLLRRYAEHGDHAAFHQLVASYIELKQRNLL